MTTENQPTPPISPSPVLVPPVQQEKDIAYRAAHDFYDKNGPGKMSLSETRQAFLEATTKAASVQQEKREREAFGEPGSHIKQ